MTASLYLDANVFILAYEKGDPAGDGARALLRAVESGRCTGVTSELSLAEVLVWPLQSGDSALAALYAHVFSPEGPLDVVAIDRRHIEAAAALRARFRSLKLPDAIHLATATTRNCDYLVSEDVRLPSVGTCRRIGADAPDLAPIVQGVP